MKLVCVLFMTAFVSVGFAETTQSKLKSPKAATAEASNKSSVAIVNVDTALKPVTAHLMANLAGLVQSKANVQLNLFGTPQAALSVAFMNSSEKTEPLRKNTTSMDITVTTTQFSVGGAYYIRPTENQANLMVNPFIVTEKKADVIDVDNNIGFGITALGMYRVNNFSFNLGGQGTLVAGESVGTFNAGVGFLF